MADETNIAQILAVSSQPWSVHCIARQLAKVCATHPIASFHTHMYSNLHRNKNYALRATKLRQQIGREEYRQLRLKFFPEGARVQVSLEELSRSSSTQEARQFAPDSDEEDEEIEADGKRSGRTGGTEVDTSEESRISIQSRATGSVPHDTPKSQRSKILSLFAATPTSAMAAAEGINREGRSTGLWPPQRTFTRSEKDRLVRKLSKWLTSLFEVAPSSQDSVVGFFKASQDVPQPPQELFSEMELEVR